MWLTSYLILNVYSHNVYSHFVDIQDMYFTDAVVRFYRPLFAKCKQVGAQEWDDLSDFKLTIIQKTFLIF
jgi:hypothetical protein